MLNPKKIFLLITLFLIASFVYFYINKIDQITDVKVLEFLKEGSYKLIKKETKATWQSTELDINLKVFLDGSEFEEGNSSGDAWEVLKDESILPPSARIVAKKIFHTKPLVVWATEWHMTPIKDLAYILKPFGVEVKDYNLDPWRCAWHDCNAKKNLQVLTGDNVLDFVEKTETDYINAYKNSEEMAKVDFVYCGYPASLCQVYDKLNKSVFIQATTRYDVGRYTADRLNRLNQDYRNLASKPWNVISGNSLYDAQFIKYYSGVKTYHIPSVCDYTGADYTGTNNKFLIFRRRDGGFLKDFQKAFSLFCKSIKCDVSAVMKEHYEYPELAAFRGVIQVPYQLSVMSIFEHYRMNIPQFVPSPQLLAHWQVKYFLMPERSFEGAFKHQRTNHSVIPPDPSQSTVPDPKNEYDYNSVLHWVSMADFYKAFPHCVVYESIPHLVHILQTITKEELHEISAKMRSFNIEFKKKILNKYRAILLRYAKNSPNKPH